VQYEDPPPTRMLRDSPSGSWRGRFPVRETVYGRKTSLFQ
jgi:hypothetical protein